MELNKILLICVLHTVCFISNVLGTGCLFPKHKQTPKEIKAYQKLSPLIGKRFTVYDPSGFYKYTVAVCADAFVGNLEFKGFGAVQETITKDNSPENYKLGKYTESQIMAGTDWVYLEYWKGEEYHNHCSGEKRKAVLMITCDETATDENPGLVILEENNNKTEHCYYLFQLNHKEMCLQSSSTFLSLGSIFIIVFFSVVIVYLLFGFLYQRFILGAKGMEQIPNYGFWKDFGNLQADGCNFVCRSGEGRGPRTYKGLGDDQLVEDAEDRDDHLLPM